jgi:hypothetical protein
MFKHTKNGQGDSVYSAEDRDGDEFSVEFYGNEMVEMMAYSDTGCIVMDKAQAIAFAELILTQLK